MRMLLAILAIVLGMNLSVNAQEHTKRPPRPSPSVTPTVPARDSNRFDPEWVAFTSDNGRFSVLMPGTPTESEETVQSAHGPYTTHLYILRNKENVYLIGWVDYDPSFNFNRQVELEMNRDNFVKGVKATLLTSSPGKVNGYNTIDFSAETPERTFKSRVYMVGRRPYQLVIGSPKGVDDSVNVSRFFSSFKVSAN
jgi:hypothetical protein